MKKFVILTLIVLTCLKYSSQNLLPTPRLLKVEKKTDDSSVTLKWKAATSQIIGYVIEKKENDGNWLIVAQAEPGENSFTDKLANTSRTCYRIRSFSVKSLSDYSNVQYCKK